LFTVSLSNHEIEEGGKPMFMTDILGRCSILEQRVADIYSQFAGSLNDDKELESFWLGMAEEEKHHSKILAAEKAALEVDSDTGYFMPEFSAKLVEMDTLLKRAEEKAKLGVTKDEAFALALEMEQSELNTIYRDLVLMGRAAVKLMARHMDQSLSLPKHQQGLLEGVKRFVPTGPTRQQAEAWVAQHHMGQGPRR
jgi:rubrerythrin